MAIKMETITRFYDEDGQIVAESERTATVPGIEEIEKEGFRSAFHQLETTVLETTDSTRQAAVSELLEELSKKTESAGKSEENSQKRDIRSRVRWVYWIHMGTN